jgi:hypothetical protein
LGKYFVKQRAPESCEEEPEGSLVVVLVFGRILLVSIWKHQTQLNWPCMVIEVGYMKTCGRLASTSSSDKKVLLTLKLASGYRCWSGYKGEWVTKSLVIFCEGNA